jgi:hypothetical protein
LNNQLTPKLVKSVKLVDVLSTVVGTLVLALDRSDPTAGPIGYEGELPTSNFMIGLLL